MHRHLSFAILFLCTWICVHRSDEVDWNYHELGPDVWRDLFPECVGPSQSPINIKTACTVHRAFSPFNLSSNYDLSQNFILFNYGHGISASVLEETLFPLTFNGGGLNGTFEFVNFHLHWGENYRSGSEHQINGEKYAGEIHFVHINRQTNQLAVLGMFIQSQPVMVSNSTNPHRRRQKRDDLRTNQATINEWERYFSSAVALKDKNSSVDLNLNLTALMGEHLNNFWRYSGSLTIPHCTEGVLWTVFTTPIRLNDSNLQSFRKNFFGLSFRGLQPLNDRIVYRNFLNDSVSSITDYNCCSKLSQATINTNANILSLLTFLLSLSSFISLII